MDDNPNGESMAPAGPEPTELPSLAQAYPRAHRAARAVLETIGLPGEPGAFDPSYDGERAERLVALILGAALLELERPWREALERANAQADRLYLDAQRRRADLVEVLGDRDRARTAYLHVSDVEGEQRATATRRGALIDDVVLRLGHLADDLRGDDDGRGSALTIEEALGVVERVHADLTQELDR